MIDMSWQNMKFFRGKQVFLRKSRKKEKLSPRYFLRNIFAYAQTSYPFVAL